MKCEDALLLISGHMDRSNTEAEEAQLQAHLSQCPDCRGLLEALLAVDAGVLSLEEEAPESLCQNVMSAIAREASVRKRRRRAWFSAAAALVLVIGIGTFALSGVRSKPADAGAAPFMEMRSRAAPEENGAVGAASAGVSLADAEGKKAAPYAVYGAVSGEYAAQSLADERQADVALVTEALPELDGCAAESLPDGSLLYTLETADSAADLCREHPDFAVLFRPEEALSEVSYALLMP